MGAAAKIMAKSTLMKTQPSLMNNNTGRKTTDKISKGVANPRLIINKIIPIIIIGITNILLNKGESSFTSHTTLLEVFLGECFLQFAW